MPRLDDTFPKIILGDHGFLPQYGSRLSPSEILDRMKYALTSGIRALSAGERFVGDAAVKAFLQTGLTPLWVRHVDLCLTLDGNRLDLPRAFSSLRKVSLSELGEYLCDDAVMGPFFEAHRLAEPLGAEECRRIALDPVALEEIVRELIELSPTFVTIGGDILDFAMAVGRQDLAADFIDAIAAAVERRNCPIYLCTYLGFANPERFTFLFTHRAIDGFMLTVNSAGAGMIPEREEVLSHVRGLGKPVLGMHVLLFGSLSPEKAITDTLDMPEVERVVVGASQRTHITALAEIARHTDAACRA